MSASLREGGRYRSLFDELPPLRADERALGRPGGPCDLGADPADADSGVGIIDGDPESFRSVDPAWAPTLPARRAGAFGLADILAPG